MDSLDDPSGHFPSEAIFRKADCAETSNIFPFSTYWQGPNDNSGFITIDLTEIFKLVAIFFKNVSTEELATTFSNDTIHWTHPITTQMIDVNGIACADIPIDRQNVGFSTRYVKLQPMSHSGSGPALRSVDFEVEEV